MKDCDTYIVIFPDDTVQLYPVLPKKENFIKNAKCYSCEYCTDIDDVREFIFTLQCPESHGYFDSVMKKEW